MRDDAHILGHLFITFVALLIWTNIERMIANAGLTGRLSTSDVMEIYGTMKSLTSANTEVGQIVPKDVREIDSKLDLFHYAERRNEPKKRGRKPKANNADLKLYPTLPS